MAIYSLLILLKDASARFHEYVHLLWDSEHELLGFQTSHKEEEWTTDRIFAAFNVTDSSEIRHSGQFTGGIQMIQKGRKSEEWLSFIMETLRRDPWIITDRYNAETKDIRPSFRGNRHDQSIQSVARKIKGFVSVTYWGAEPTEPIQAVRWKVMRPRCWSCLNERNLLIMALLSVNCALCCVMVICNRKYTSLKVQQSDHVDVAVSPRVLVVL